MKFEDERLIWQILHSCVRESLAKYGGVGLMDFSPDIMRDLPFYPKSAPLIKPEVSIDKSYNPFLEADADVRGAARRTAREEGHAPLPAAADGPPQRRAPEDPAPSAGAQLEGLVCDFVPAGFVQYQNAYLVTPLRGGLALVDQHRAHARILYEEMGKKPLSPANAHQLLFPQTIDLLPDMALDIQGFLDEVASIGLMAKCVGPLRIEVYALPAGASSANPEELFHALLEQYASQEEGIAEIRARRHLATLAFSAAVRRGAPLSHEMGVSILQGLFRCEQPAVDPLQRPTLQIIGEDDIDSWFSVKKR